MKIVFNWNFTKIQITLSEAASSLSLFAGKNWVKDRFPLHFARQSKQKTVPIEVPGPPAMLWKAKI